MGVASAASYDDKAGGYFELAREEMLAFVPEGARRILEVGCGSGAFSGLLRARGAHVTGIEPFESAASAARHRLDEVIVASAEDGMRAVEPGAFDCVVFNDVLEHLVEPTAVLRDARSVLAPGGVVVASIPNLRYFPVLRDLVLRADFRYADDGVLDRTHLRFFTARSMKRMVEEAGYRVDRMVGINALHASWKRRAFEAATFGRMADTRFQQFAIVASPRSVAE